MITNLKSSFNLLNLVREETDSIGIGLSFGKDSLATLDLCSRIFKKVEAYYLFRVRNLRIIKEWAAFVLKRYKIKVEMYPHFDLSRCYQNAIFQPHWRELKKTPSIKMLDIDNYFRQKKNIEWIALGWRRNDSLSRALIMKQCGGIDFKNKRVFPLRIWKRNEVYEYLKVRKIPIPPTLGRKEQGGFDFHPLALRELKDNYPDDYRKWIVDFPFSEVQLLDQEKYFPKS